MILFKVALGRIAFDAFEGPEYGRAVELARRSPVYRELEQGLLELQRIR